MNKTLLAAALFLVCAARADASAVNGNAVAGKQKAAACAACHGADGNTPIDANTPKLAGQYPDYLLKALKDYKSGKRSNAIMAAQVKDLSEADMANLAVYFASLPGQIGIIKP